MSTVSVPFLLDDTVRAPDDPVVSLRAHAGTDVERVWEQCQDPDSQRWTTVPVPYSLEDARTFVGAVMPAGWESGSEWAFAVDVDGRFGGTVSLRPEAPGRAEVAYGSHPDVRGTGAMERALRLLLTWGFEQQRLRTVTWWANRGNWASRRLAWRLGFDVTPTPLRCYLDHRDELVDAWVGTLLATDPRTPRTSWLVAPRVESPRLPVRLRAFRDSDTARHTEAATDPSTTYWLSGIRADYTEQTCRDGLVESGEQAAAGTGLAIACAATDDDRLVGRISLFGLDPLRCDAEIGYWVHPDARGRGVATEMVRLVLRHCLLPVTDGGLGHVRVRAHAAVENAASRRALVSAGMREVGVEARGTKTKDGFTDAVLYEALEVPD